MTREPSHYTNHNLSSREKHIIYVMQIRRTLYGHEKIPITRTFYVNSHSKTNYASVTYLEKTARGKDTEEQADYITRPRADRRADVFKLPKTLSSFVMYFFKSVIYFYKLSKKTIQNK